MRHVGPVSRDRNMTWSANVKKYKIKSNKNEELKIIKTGVESSLSYPVEQLHYAYTTQGGDT